MRAGRLRRVVSLQRPIYTQSATGAPRITDWATIDGAAAVYADIDEGSGKEQLQAGQINPQRPLTVTIRYFVGITADTRVLYGQRVFEIVSAQNLDQRNRTLVLLCVEKTGILTENYPALDFSVVGNSMNIPFLGV